ncbi:uncharacterized protein LOC126106406 [Schistocerca cancellata]|uniref:uncharacterized protein LOC126106406 n=1 Tax=Schistocerca cancellata TaxID=274614 RepID=UPI00211775F1|nr:uncharacterized protein LOC126106406 [Schistocerca cancellata]
MGTGVPRNVDKTEESQKESSFEIIQKLNNMDQKLDQTLNELANLKEIVKNCHCHSTQATATKSSGSTETNNVEEIGITVSPDEQCSEAKNCVPNLEKKRYPIRRAQRQNNKGAPYAYE